MLRADRRFVVSHVGSMVRPPAMIPYLQKQQAGEPYDQSAFEACLAESVIEAVRLQAEAGIDVVSDGEYGKSGTWAFYVHRRLGGLEWRRASSNFLRLYPLRLDPRERCRARRVTGCGQAASRCRACTR